MMIRYVLFAVVLVVGASGCEQTNFGGGAAKKTSYQDVLPAGGIQNEVNPPLDISETEQNQPIREDQDGPTGAEGERLSKAIDLECDESTGVIVDIDTGDFPDGGGSGGSGGDPNIGEEPDPNATPKLLLGQPEIDKNGKPVGPQPDGGKKPLPEKPTIDVPQNREVVAKVKGKFCPTSKNKLTVLFVVDYSGSMGRHVPEAGEDEVPGNDPQVNGSCGRLQAAQAIIERIRAEKLPADQVQIGMVPFAGGIVTKHIMEIVDLEEFASRVSKDTFCQYVVQNDSFGFDRQNPGGISGNLGLLNNVDSSTNYRAAFQAAETILTPVYGRKVVYFISDGQPTSGGADPVAAGAAAGQSLRQSVDNLTMNSLLLGELGPEARAVLEEVTGSSDRVTRVENAAELAEQILEFPEASIDEDTARALLSVVPYNAEELGLHFFGPHPSEPGVWIYETQPFVVVGKPGETVVNVVEVTAEGSDGSTHAARVEVRYTQ